MKKKVISIILITVLVMYYNQISYATGYTQSTSTGTGYSQSSPTETYQTEIITTNPVENPHSSGTTTTSGTGTTVAGPYGTSGTSSTPSTSVGPYGAEIVMGEDGTPYSTGQGGGSGQSQQQQQSTTTTTPSAGTTGTSDVTSVINPDDYKPDTLTQADAQEFMDIVGTILGALRIFGSAVCIIALMVLGVRYMLGSTSEKATYKETMVPYLIGAIMVFIIPTVIQIIYDLVKEIDF